MTEDGREFIDAVADTRIARAIHDDDIVATDWEVCVPTGLGAVYAALGLATTAESQMRWSTAIAEIERLLHPRGANSNAATMPHVGVSGSDACAHLRCGGSVRRMGWKPGYAWVDVDDDFGGMVVSNGQ